MKNKIRFSKKIPRLLDIKVPWTQIEPNERESVNCAICGSNTAKPIYSIVLNNEEFYLVKCQNDNLIWLNPQPGMTFLKTLYSEAYFQVDKNNEKLLQQVGIKDVTEEDQQYRLQTARNQVMEWQKAGIFPQDIKTGQKRRLLEVGGGRGYLQQMAEEAGWETLGLEISKYGIKEGIKKGLTILPVMLEDLEGYLPSAGYFNLVAMYDFIEHATNPGKIIRSLKDILAKDQESYLTIRTPNADEKKGPDCI